MLIDSEVVAGSDTYLVRSTHIAPNETASNLLDGEHLTTT